MNTPTIWQSHEAKTNFDELLEKTLAEGNQIIVRHGDPVAMVVPIPKIKVAKPKRHVDSLITCLLNSPLAGSGIELEDRRQPGSERREVAL